jgi:hypothetical protein
MVKFIISFLLIINSILFAQGNMPVKAQEVVVKAIPYNPNVECVVLSDEDSIICKFEVIRAEKEQQVTLNWISPTGEISRTREMIINAGDSTAYDYRHIDGRENGKWSFKIIYNEKEYISQFELNQ